MVPNNQDHRHAAEIVGQHRQTRVRDHRCGCGGEAQRRRDARLAALPRGGLPTWSVEPRRARAHTGGTGPNAPHAFRPIEFISDLERSGRGHHPPPGLVRPSRAHARRRRVGQGWAHPGAGAATARPCLPATPARGGGVCVRPAARAGQAQAQAQAPSSEHVVMPHPAPAPAPTTRRPSDARHLRSGAPRRQVRGRRPTRADDAACRASACPADTPRAARCRR